MTTLKTAVWQTIAAVNQTAGSPSGTQVALRPDAAMSQVVCVQQLRDHDKLRIEL